MQPVKRFVGWIAGKFERDSRAWGLTPGLALGMMAIPLIVMLGMIVLVRVPELFVWITAEDSLMEWLQVLLVLAASINFARLSLTFFKGSRPGIGLLYGIVALGAFFVAGEEIAWGQRIFGWGTPEALQAMNYQNETTVHNISSAHQLFINAIMLGGLYGALIPLLAWVLWNERPRSPLSYLLVPPLFLVPAFFMPFGFRFGRQLLDLDVRLPHLIFYITKFSEGTELCLYFGLAVYSWLYLRKIQSQEQARTTQPYYEERSSRTLAK